LLLSLAADGFGGYSLPPSLRSDAGCQALWSLELPTHLATSSASGDNAP
jgi:hypothetical protein